MRTLHHHATTERARREGGQERGEPQEDDERQFATAALVRPPAPFAAVRSRCWLAPCNFAAPQCWSLAARTVSRPARQRRAWSVSVSEPGALPALAWRRRFRRSRCRAAACGSVGVSVGAACDGCAGFRRIRIDAMHLGFRHRFRVGRRGVDCHHGFTRCAGNLDRLIFRIGEFLSALLAGVAQ